MWLSEPILWVVMWVQLCITNNTQTNPEYFLSSYVMKDKEIERHGFVGPAIRFRKEQFFEAK